MMTTTYTKAHCKTCSAILPQSEPIRLDNTPGNEHVKRAIEVALAYDPQPLSITFCGIGSGDQAVHFAWYVASRGGAAYAILPCPCGNYGDDQRACLCTPRAIAKYHTRPAVQNALRASMFVEVLRVSEDKVIAYANGRRSESDECIFERIAAAKELPMPDTSLDDTSAALLRAALRQLCLTTDQVQQLLAVAQSVTRLAGSPSIRPVYLAEALQYRSRMPIIPQGVTESGTQS